MNRVKELIDNIDKYNIKEIQYRFSSIVHKEIDIDSKQEEVESSPLSMMQTLIETCLQDDRKGVQNIAQTFLRQQQKQEAERQRTHELYQHELDLWHKGVVTVAGIDEVGRGCVAGPVVAGVVILPMDPQIQYLNDSKKLSSEQREVLDKEIRAKAIDFAIGEVDATRIDEIGIVSATFEAMRQALTQLTFPPNHILVDAFKIPGVKGTQTNIIGGDRLSASIAAASIIAKVYRDKKMIEFANQFPDYGFDKHKGYGTPEHIASIESYGMTTLHRTTFLKNLIF